MKILSILLSYLIVFAVGGLLCLIAQILIIKTKLTPARILVIFLCFGIFLETIGVYKYIYNFAHSGISVPIIGFGAALARGAISLAREIGFVGAFAGGLANTGYGVGIAIFLSYFITFIFSPKSK